MKFSRLQDMAFAEWLGGLSLTQKIKTLEIDRLVQCGRCQIITGEDDARAGRQRGQCHEGLDHRFIEYGKHIVLKRTGAIIEGAILCGFKDDVKKAILEFFQIKK